VNNILNILSISLGIWIHNPSQGSFKGRKLLPYPLWVTKVPTFKRRFSVLVIVVAVLVMVIVIVMVVMVVLAVDIHSHPYPAMVVRFAAGSERRQSVKENQNHARNPKFH
jgi:hypothetical protein